LDPLIGQVLAGRYEILRAIGAGGMGVVYEAVQLDLGRRVALKVLPRGPDPRDLARLRTEVLAVAAASHAHVVPMIECRDDHDPPFFVMELLHGLTLATVLRQGSLPVERAVKIAVQVLSALGAAHAAGVVHRDIKPANVFLVQTPGVGDVVKVLDFGVAKVEGGTSSTTTGSLVGTPAYMAPEQVLGGAIGPRTDVHAVGLLLFEMLTGRRPFDGVPARMPYEPAPPLAMVRPDLPPALANVVACALEKDPSRRFPSAAAMLDALVDPRLTQSGAVPAQAQAQARSGSGTVFVIALLSVLLVGAVVAAAALGHAFVTASSEGPSPSAGASVAAPVASAPTPREAPPVDVPPASTATTALPSGLRPRPVDAGAPRADAGAAAGDAGAPPGRRLAIAVVYSSTFLRAITDPERAVIARSTAGVSACIDAHAAGKFAAGDQIGVRISEATGKPSSVFWSPAVPTGNLPEFYACVEKVALGWNLGPKPGSALLRVYFNLS
jgi:serine/threonine-protein kinase